MASKKIFQSAMRAPARAFSTGSKVALPDLPYGYSALEPTVSGAIMEIHHSKHHNAYVTNFNAALEQYDQAAQKKDYAKMIALQGAIKFNGGGHINHSIFWTNLAPTSKGGGAPPTGDLLAAINKDFGSLDNLKNELNTKSAAIQGSGWGWLGYNKAANRLQVATMANQDPLTDLVPLLGIDVWEHAYYLQYKNVRPEYLKAIWNVVNWSNVAERLKAAK